MSSKILFLSTGAFRLYVLYRRGFKIISVCSSVIRSLIVSFSTCLLLDCENKGGRRGRGGRGGGGGWEEQFSEEKEIVAEVMNLVEKFNFCNNYLISHVPISTF